MTYVFSKGKIDDIFLLDVELSCQDLSALGGTLVSLEGTEGMSKESLNFLLPLFMGVEQTRQLLFPLIGGGLFHVFSGDTFHGLQVASTITTELQC